MLLGGKAIADGTSRVHAGSTEVSPMNLLGTFAPYMTVHQDSVVKIDDSVPFETAAIMGCAVPTGFGSATNVAEVQPGETVVIVGVGGIGMSALQGAVIAGARNVVAIDPVEFKREQAIKFGATHVYPSMAEAIEPVINLTQGFMAEKTIIAVGDMRGEYIEEAMTLTAKTGTCVVTGMGAMTRRRRQAQPVPVHDVAENVEGQHLRRRQQPRRDARSWSGSTSRDCSRSTRWSPAPTGWKTSTTAIRTCSTARTSAASSATTRRTGSRRLPWAA